MTDERSAVYMEREQEKLRRAAYRQAARDLIDSIPMFAPGSEFRVPEHAPVQETIDKTGAFVEVVMWIPCCLVTHDNE